MQNKTIKMLRSLLVMITAGLIVASCNKKFDQPPAFIEPNVTVNTTIKALKQNHIIGAIEKIEEDLIIGGVVVADDKTGNFYKSIAIQDETGGITVRLDGTNLYTSYPVGRKIYINLKGLYIGDYNRLIQIGGGIDNTDPSRPELSPLAANLFDTYIIKGSAGNAVTPKVVTVAELHDSLQSMLIQLDNMEFVSADTSKTYADVAGKQSVNLSVKGCTGNSVIVRTSGYASFAGENVPNGNGTLLAIYTMFGNTKQLVIRGPEDVQFTGTRCGAGPLTEMNIADLRALHTGADVNVPNGRKIAGVVISDRVGNNQDSRNMILQQGDGRAGIFIRFADPHTFDLGDSLVINVSNQSLEDYNGTLQLNGVPNDWATKVGTGTITPRVATAADVLANFEAWESTLVQINDVTITGGNGGNWSGTTTFTDATGAVKSFTRSAATFSGTAYPTEAEFVKGYLSQFNADLQLNLRNTSDVEAKVAPPPPPPPTGTTTVEDFESTTKTNYTDGSVTLTTGSWFIADGGIYTDANDLKIGANTTRLRGTNLKDAVLRTEFDIQALKTVKLSFGGTLFSEGTDAGTGSGTGAGPADKEISLELFISKDGGTTWTSLGKKMGVRGTLTEVEFDVNAAATENVRVQIVNSSYLRPSNNNRIRINVDNVTFIK